MFNSFSALNAQVPTPTSKDHVAFIFTCLDPGSNDHYEVFQGLDLVDAYDIGEEGVSGVSIDPPSSSPSGYTEINVDNIDDYRGFGVVGLYGETSGGEFFNLSVYFIECCEGPPTPSLIIAEQEPISFWEPSAVISGEQVLVLGNIEIDVSVNFDNNLFEMGTDASFELDRDTDLESFNDIYQPYCEFRWDRIFAPGIDNSITLEGNTFWTGALRGVHGEVNAHIEIIESKADNNIISILLDNYEDGGPYGSGSYFKIENSTIELKTDLYSFDQHPSSPINMNNYLNFLTNYTTLGFGIRVLNSDYIEIGQASYDYNTFDFDTDNEFAHLGITDSWVVVENNDFFDVSYSIQALESAVRIGGPSVAQGNYFDGTHLLFKEGSTNIQNCYFEGMPLIGTHNERKVIMLDSEPLTPPDGLEGNHVLNNYFYNFFLEVFQSTPSTNLDVDVKDNIAEASVFHFEGIHGNPPFPTNPRLTINDNTMLNGFRDFLVKLEDCNHATIGDNTFRNTQTSYNISSSQGTEAVGVYIDNSQNVSLYSNTFVPLVASPDPEIGFKSGVYAANNIQGLQFYCNEFYNVYNGVQFYDGVITTSIGFPNTSPGTGANNTFELLPGFPGTGSLWSSPFSSILVHFLLMPNQIDYFWDGTAGSMYDPDPYGGGIVFLRGAVFGDANGGVGCPSIPQKRFEPMENNFETNVNHSILAYPNPANEQMIIEIPEDYLNSSYFITDAQGKVIKSDKVLSEQLRLTLPQGQYILMIDTPSSSPMRKKLVFIH
ncbi:MAG: T9SS type A sorting domain-containing protein [Cryomorphaceae bacterium]|nr:T9SS type A sorting domain-containing protein [Cryomorphaceae bacterium]